MNVEGQRVAHSLRQSLESVQKELEVFILSTPSGEDRNLLTDANIHLMVAIAALQGITP